MLLESQNTQVQNLKEANTATLSEVLPKMAEFFLKKVKEVEVTHAFYVAEEKKVELYDSSGNKKDVFIKMVFSGEGLEVDYDLNSSWLSIVLYDSEVRMKTHITDFRTHYKYEKVGDVVYIAHRTWSLSLFKDEQRIEVTSRVDTSPRFGGVAVASNLFTFGEKIKDGLIEILSTKVSITLATTKIFDVSSPQNWTARRVQDLDDYHEVGDGEFIKTKNIT